MLLCPGQTDVKGPHATHHTTPPQRTLQRDDETAAGSLRAVPGDGPRIIDVPVSLNLSRIDDLLGVGSG
ncbi:hypothetical protein [Phytobacter ursingii]|uniref:Uncharacterized protein n=1 Tax=Phytobacter ursingii TaxID=1972431 RepID=A0AAC8QJL6_9ENTR|nr:hypothetical protein [Phytobacter ursingii]AKL09936.1 hypothetical protein AB182_00835 [Phytobacter ursingii]